MLVACVCVAARGEAENEGLLLEPSFRVENILTPSKKMSTKGIGSLIAGSVNTNSNYKCNSISVQKHVLSQNLTVTLIHCVAHSLCSAPERLA